MDEPNFSTKYRAQVYDVALNAFFKLREFDAASTKRTKVEVGWDIAEALVAAAVSGVTYKSESHDRWFEAAQMLRQFADTLEDDGLESLEWGYRGKLDARHAWRPDIRTDEGRAELDTRVSALIEATYRPLRALTVADRQAIICLAYVRNALEQLVSLASDPEEGTRVRQLVVETAGALVDQFQAVPGAAAATEGSKAG